MFQNKQEQIQEDSSLSSKENVNDSNSSENSNNNNYSETESEGILNIIKYSDNNSDNSCKLKEDTNRNSEDLEFVEIRNVGVQVYIDKGLNKEEGKESIEIDDDSTICNNIMTNKQTIQKSTGEKNKSIIVKRKKSEKFEKYTSISDDRLKSISYKINKDDILKKEQSIFSPNIRLPQTLSPTIKYQTELRNIFDPSKYQKKQRKKHVQTTTFVLPNEEDVLPTLPIKSLLKITDNKVKQIGNNSLYLSTFSFFQAIFHQPNVSHLNIFPLLSDFHNC